MLDGTNITLGGREFVAPPAPFSVMRKYADIFNGRQQPDVMMMADVVLVAIKRNYPDLTQEEFEEKYLDVNNLRTAFDAVMKVSGGVRGQELGEAAPGSV